MNCVCLLPLPAWHKAIRTNCLTQLPRWEQPTTFVLHLAFSPPSLLPSSCPALFSNLLNMVDFCLWETKVSLQAGQEMNVFWWPWSLASFTCLSSFCGVLGSLWKPARDGSQNRHWNSQIFPKTGKILSLQSAFSQTSAKKKKEEGKQLCFQ